MSTMIAKVLKRIKAKELNFCPWETLLMTGYFTDGVFAMIGSERLKERAKTAPKLSSFYVPKERIERLFITTGEHAEYLGSEAMHSDVTAIGDRAYLFRSSVNTRRKKWRYDGEIVDWLDEQFPCSVKRIEGDLLRWIVDGKCVAVLRGIPAPKKASFK